MKQYILNHRKPVAYVAMALIVVVWALELIVGKIALSSISPVQLSFLRFTTSTVTIFAIMKLMKAESKIEKTDWPLLIMSAIIGTFLYFLCEYSALERIPASLVSIILALLPVVSLLIEIAFFHKTAGRKKTICVFISLFGTAFVIAGAGVEMRLNLLGFLLAFASVVFWAISNYMLVSLLQKYNAIALTFYRHIITTLALMPLFIANPTAASDFSPKVVFAVLFLGTFCSAFIFIIYGIVIREIGALPVSVFCNLLPVLTVSASFVILRERLTPIQLIGCVLVLVSIFLIIDYKKKEEPKAPPFEEF